MLATGDLAESTPDARANVERLSGAGPQPFAAGALDGHAGYVDALLGTGFSGEPRGAVAAAIDALNSSSGPVVSADIPSGVDASTGEVAGQAVTRRGDGDIPSGQARAVDQSRQAACG